MAATRRPRVEGFEVAAWAARYDATVSGAAGRADTPRPSHHSRNMRKSVLQALRVLGAFSALAKSRAAVRSAPRATAEAGTVVRSVDIGISIFTSEKKHYRK